MGALDIIILICMLWYMQVVWCEAKEACFNLNKAEDILSVGDKNGAVIENINKEIMKLSAMKLESNRRKLKKTKKISEAYFVFWNTHGSWDECWRNVK